MEANVSDTVTFALVVFNLTAATAPDPINPLLQRPLGNLQGFDIQMSWNPSVLNLTSCTVTIPWNSYQTPVAPSPYGGVLYAQIFELANETDPADSIPGAEPGTMLWRAYASMNFTTPFNGNGTLLITTFKVIGAGSSLLKLTSCALADYSGHSLLFHQSNAYFHTPSGTVYIRADGSIDPQEAPISTIDNVTYTFTDNINDSIVIERDNIVVDGASYTMTGSGNGITLTDRSNVTARNMTTKNFLFGIVLSSSSNNIVSDNNVANNWWGIWLSSSSNNTLSGNNVTANNGDGIGLYSFSNNNVFYHNNFINNTQQVYIKTSYANSWDDGYPSGGNYWSDYTGVDKEVSPHQDVPGSDGIGDTPYIIDVNNRDCYPLMKPWTTTREPAIYISAPYHSQINSYYCGPAALEMVFHFYGPDIPQLEIADVARTAPDGTYTSDMIRAVHFSNLSTSVGEEMPGNIIGYTARQIGYVAFEYQGMTIDELKSLIAEGYPIVVLTTWHFRVAVGFNSTHITFQDSYYGEMFNMTYQEFDTDWDYSSHWGLFVRPWEIKVSTSENVPIGSVFNVTATITYPAPPPFSTNQYSASAANATVTLPAGLTLVSGEMAKKTIDAGSLAAGEPANVTWTVRADTLGNYTISVEAEGKVTGFVPPLPSYPEPYAYEDRIGGFSQSAITVISSTDKTAPTTSDNYDDLWHGTDFTMTLTATDDLSGVAETYYKINDGTTKTVSAEGQPLITTEGANNTLEYWSIDNAGNEESHHILVGIRLDKTAPTIEIPSREPAGDVQPHQSVKVSVNVTDTISNVKNVTLHYSLNNGTSWEAPISMNYNASTNLYEVTILGQQAGTWVKYKIIAYDYAGNNATLEGTEPYFVYQVVPEFPSFLIPPLFMIATLLAVIVYKRRARRQRYRTVS
jgi:parallel beta-helix repeat protein